MKKLLIYISRIFKFIWRTISFARNMLTNLLFILMLVVGYFVLTSFSERNHDMSYDKPSALVLELNSQIVEQLPVSDLLSSVNDILTGNKSSEIVLFDLVSSIIYAKDDPLILGIVLKLEQLPEVNLTKLRYIGNALAKFKKSGKEIYAISSSYNQSQYYLASFADQIFLAPDGVVALQGYNTQTIYYKTLLENLDVTTHVFRVGSYKSAVEPFMRTNMSTKAREAALSWLVQLWDTFSADASQNRGIDSEIFNLNAEQMLSHLKQANGSFAQLALNLGLVDKLATAQEIDSFLIEKFNLKTSKQSKHYKRAAIPTYQSIDYRDYSFALNQLSLYQQDPKLDNVALLVASGVIYNGEQTDHNIGADTLVYLLRSARFDPKVKAVVLRVDSSGGSATASELIYNEIIALKNAGKPVVVSMSSFAASGGYWLALGASKIIAEPTTLTGSIGIFGIFSSFEKTLDKIGITTDSVGTHNDLQISPLTKMSPNLSAILQLNVDHSYQRFISRVSSARNIDLAKIDNIAQGRVWTGSDALRLGLVDELGGFDHAITVAASLANLEQYNISWLKNTLSPAHELFNTLVNASLQMGVENLNVGLTQVLNMVTKDAELLEHFNDPQGLYAVCLTCEFN